MVFGSPLHFVQKCKLPKNHAVGVHISSTLNPKVKGKEEELRKQRELIEAIKHKLECDDAGLRKISVEKILSFPLINPHKESAGYVKAKEGILNIDLLSNPMLSTKYAAVPSVSRILNDTLSVTSQKALARWKEKMIQDMGQDKFTVFQQEQLQQGKDMHKAIKEFLITKELDTRRKPAKASVAAAPETLLNPVTEKSLASVRPVLKHISDVVAVESFVVHPHLGYKGILDCIAKYRNKPLLIEWKLCAKSKADIKSTYDAPIQLLAYLGALNYDKNYNVQVDGVMVVVAHLDGSPADTFFVPIDDCKRFWSLWLRRLKKYSKKYNES